MDRYVLVISFCRTDDESPDACSLSGSPSARRWYFAVQACHGGAQIWCLCQSLHQRSYCVISFLTSYLLNTISALQQFYSSLLMEEAAEGLHVLSDKLPPPGKALLDVLVLGSAEQSPPVKDLLPLLGAVKHMSSWHAAKISVITQHTPGWQKMASSISAALVKLADLDSCIDSKEMWRGSLLVREKKVRVAGVTSGDGAHFQTSDAVLCEKYGLFCFFSLIHLQVFHYYAPVLDLVQLVNLSDLPSFLISSAQFELYPYFKVSVSVGALFSLSCVITPIAQPAASQLSSQRWRESLSRRPKSLPGKTGVSQSLWQQQKRAVSPAGKYIAVLLISLKMSLLFFCLSGAAAGNILHSLPCLQGDYMLRRERRVSQVQKLALQEYLSKSASIPVSDLKVILNLARENYLKKADSTLPTAAACLTDNQPSKSFQMISQLPSDWPERSVLHNVENLQKRRQKRRFGLLGPGSSDSLLGPKDGQRGSSTLLDAKELLKHFTSDGLPAGELQPLAINRGNNAFQLSQDLSPRRVSKLPFSKASASHYHGIEFCLDNQRSLDRDQAFVRLQSRLIRYETQTTCSKEPCALPFALSPAPSPAVMSEPGSVPDGETLQNNDVARLKRKSWEADIVGGYPHKRLAKSESSDSICSQSSSSSGTHPAIRSLRRQPSRSQSTSSVNSSSSSATRPTSGKAKKMLQEVVAKTLKHHGITAEHDCFEACSKRLFDISKFYLKDLRTSRGLHDEMRKAASSNVKQVIDWVLEKTSKQ
uniref:MDM2 binding protein n=1 Tax=Pundamilia nyererei TaxID=303518 RepID=A0A3B4F402_9CICH